MHPFKSPGPDELSPVFFLKYWKIVGKDVSEFVLNFLNHNPQLLSANPTNLIFIRKINQPELPADFRPIILCNVSYKIASKVFANRLQSILPLIISEAQSAFVLGRLITDNILIAHDTHHFLNHRKSGSKGLMSIKLDMPKAFDRLEWSFVLATLKALGFHHKFIDLAHSCISTSSFSFLLSGAQTFFSL
ncbi:hypothetical protein OROMI_013687 [Orobanche minor]